MKVRVIIGGFPWEYKGPPAPKLEKRLLEVFAQYQPKKSGDIAGAYGYPAYELSAEADDPQFEKLLRDFTALLKTANPPAAAAVEESPQGEEVERARFLEPYFYGDFVDEDSCRNPLNPGLYLCKECECPNLAYLPKPFLVNKNVLKKYDVFLTGVSMIIVRSHVLDLLKDAVGDQILFGEASIAKAKTQPKGDDRLFWVRPKQFLGKRIRVIDGEKLCPACGRVSPKWVGGTDHQVNKLGPGLFDGRYRIEHFGSTRTDIALVPGCGNEWPAIVMSGALLAHLQANDVKGIIAFTKKLDARCVFSAKGEPTLEAQVRTFARTTSPEKLKQDKAKLHQVRKATGLLKAVPWDCTNDGHIYFHLTTPEFVVLDPMTLEEDSGGPYKVKDFKGPGVYRLSVSAIKNADEEKRGVAVDSGVLLFVDNLFLAALLDAYEWDKAITARGNPDWNYHQRIAEKVGTRFGVCTPPPKKFKSDFCGDGFYRIDTKGIRPVKS